jgi:hypothetical protein
MDEAGGWQKEQAEYEIEITYRSGSVDGEGKDDGRDSAKGKHTQECQPQERQE